MVKGNLYWKPADGSDPIPLNYREEESGKIYFSLPEGLPPGHLIWAGKVVSELEDPSQSPVRERCLRIYMLEGSNAGSEEAAV